MEEREVSLEDILEAKKNLEKVLYRTHCIPNRTFSKISNNNVFIKTENLQRTGSFKIRGAYNKIVNLTQEEKSKGVIASSAGNHAQGVALAATAHGIQSTIIMPEYTPLAKVTATKTYGANVILHGANYDEAYHKAMEVQKETKATFVHPFDDPFVIAGQGTIGLEILEEMPDVDAIVAPVGGGGLLAGIALAVKSINPKVKVIGVEAETSSCMRYSLDHKKVCTIDIQSTLADGIAVKTPGSLTYKLIEKYVDDIVVVSEGEIAKTILMLLERTRLMVEGAGAVGVAALLNNKLSFENKKVVSLVSGGNIDTNMLAKIIHRGLLNAGRKVNFTMTLLDKPGELLKIAEIFSRHRANVLSISHNRDKREVDLGDSKVELTLETQDHQHIERILTELKEKGYEVTVE